MRNPGLLTVHNLANLLEGQKTAILRSSSNIREATEVATEQDREGLGFGRRGQLTTSKTLQPKTYSVLYMSCPHAIVLVVRIL